MKIDLAASAGTNATAATLAQNDRPVQILRLVITAHRSALRDAIENRTPLNTPTYVLPPPQQGLVPTNADLTAIRASLIGNNTQAQFGAANSRLLSKILNYVTQTLRDHLFSATNIVDTGNGAAAAASHLKWQQRYESMNVSKMKSYSTTTNHNPTTACKRSSQTYKNCTFT